MNFKGWNTYGFIQAKSVWMFIQCMSGRKQQKIRLDDTKSGVFTEAKKVHLQAEDGATIYYTTDGSTAK